MHLCLSYIIFYWLSIISFIISLISSKSSSLWKFDKREFFHLQLSSVILDYKNNPPGALNQSFKTTDDISYTDLNDALFYLLPGQTCPVWNEIFFASVTQFFQKPLGQIACTLHLMKRNGYPITVSRAVVSIVDDDDWLITMCTNYNNKIVYTDNSSKIVYK